jgi:hypothetical protein
MTMTIVQISAAVQATFDGSSSSSLVPNARGTGSVPVLLRRRRTDRRGGEDGGVTAARKKLLAASIDFTVT